MGGGWMFVFEFSSAKDAVCCKPVRHNEKLKNNTHLNFQYGILRRWKKNYFASWNFLVQRLRNNSSESLIFFGPPFFQHSSFPERLELIFIKSRASRDVLWQDGAGREMKHFPAIQILIRSGSHKKVKSIHKRRNFSVFHTTWNELWIQLMHFPN